MSLESPITGGGVIVAMRGSVLARRIVDDCHASVCAGHDLGEAIRKSCEGYSHNEIAHACQLLNAAQWSLEHRLNINAAGERLAECECQLAHRNLTRIASGELS